MGVRGESDDFVVLWVRDGRIDVEVVDAIPVILPPMRLLGG